jgi:hypothetical protein
VDNQDNQGSQVKRESLGLLALGVRVDAAVWAERAAPAVLPIPRWGYG